MGGACVDIIYIVAALGESVPVWQARRGLGGRMRCSIDRWGILSERDLVMDFPLRFEQAAWGCSWTGYLSSEIRQVLGE